MTPAELKSALEAIIYAADEPATLEQLANVLGEEKHVVRAALDELVASYANDERGVEIRAVAGGYRVYTKPQHHDLVRRFIKSLRPPLRLTMPALETLAVIAYKQPVTQPEIQEIRGVNCAGVLETLLEKRLIITAGRKQVIGRPILYRTSKDFLMRFGLGDLDELPSLKEFEALAREALGADDGVAEATECEAGESLSPDAASTDMQDAETPAAAEISGESAVPQSDEPSGLGSAVDDAREIAGEAMGTVLGSEENAPRDEQLPAAEASANPGGGIAAEKPGDADRAAKKAAPGSSE